MINILVNNSNYNPRTSHNNSLKNYKPPQPLNSPPTQHHPPPLHQYPHYISTSTTTTTTTPTTTTVPTPIANKFSFRTKRTTQNMENAKLKKLIKENNGTRIY